MIVQGPLSDKMLRLSGVSHRARPWRFVPVTGTCGGFIYDLKVGIRVVVTVPSGSTYGGLLGTLI